MAVVQLALLALPLLAWYLWTKLRYHRLHEFKHFPQPPPDATWGHLQAINEAGNAAGVVKGRHSDYDFEDLWTSIGKPQVCLFDLRPFMYPMLMVCDHAIAEQFSRPSALFKYSTYKSPTTKELAPIIGHKSILVSEDEHWKQQRKRYNAGFAPSHLVTQLPRIVDKTRLFLARLDAHAAKRDQFALDELCVDLTFDIIGAVVMDLDFHAQEPQPSREAQAMKNTLHAFSGDKPFDRVNPFVQFRRWRLGNVIDERMKEAVRGKFNELRAAADADANADGKAKSRPRSVVGIALEGNDTLADDVLQDAADQIKTFIFAGHDTTSTLLQWILYELTRQPRVLALVCGELDRVLGPSSSPDAVAAALVRGGDALLNRLTYTSAVIKEALRMYPPAGSARMSPPGSGATVTLTDGTELCVDGLVIYLCHYIIQRDESVYGPDANRFVPERWLGDTETSMSGTDREHANEKLSATARAAATLDASEEGNDAVAAEQEQEQEQEQGQEQGQDRAKIPASAWRPFERGPRNCIGQELANLETRVILAMAVRRYTFTKVGGMGELLRGADGKPVLDDNGVYVVKQPMINKRQITPKPFDGMLVTVEINQAVGSS